MPNVHIYDSECVSRAHLPFFLSYTSSGAFVDRSLTAMGRISSILIAGTLGTTEIWAKAHTYISISQTEDAKEETIEFEKGRTKEYNDKPKHYGTGKFRKRAWQVNRCVCARVCVKGAHLGGRRFRCVMEIGQRIQFTAKRLEQLLDDVLWQHASRL